MTIFELLERSVFVIDSYLVPLIFSLAFLLFIWGVFKYFIAGGDKDEAHEQGRKFVMYALIGFVLIIAIWGIINVLIATLGFKNTSRPPLPTFETPSDRTNNDN